MFLFFMGRFLGTELLCCVITLCLVFEETAKWLSSVVVLLSVPTSNAKGPGSAHVFTHTCLCYSSFLVGVIWCRFGF